MLDVQGLNRSRRGRRSSTRRPLYAEFGSSPITRSYSAIDALRKENEYQQQRVVGSEGVWRSSAGGVGYRATRGGPRRLFRRHRAAPDTAVAPHMLTSAGYPANTVGNLELNTVWDGLFHTSTYISTAVGLALLWSATRLPHVRWSTMLLIGGLLVGWGTFNVVEGIVDHHILQIHHVKEDSANQLAWDLGFLAWGAIMLVGGLTLMRTGDRETERETATATR